MAVLAFMVAGCAARAQTQATADTTLEQQAIQATQLQSRLQVIFNWSLQDRDARFSGEGVTRLEPPYMARLDLFGPRGEGYLSAALVDFDLRLPPGATTDLLPPPNMFWSVLGVFRAPEGAQLVSARGDTANGELRYRAGQQSWTFAFSNGHLRRAEWQGPEQGKQTVEIRDYDTRGLPKRVVYRDWRAFRELTLTLTQAYDVESFPPETWLPGIR